MISKIKELLRWIIFIPAPFIAGPLLSAILSIPIFIIFANADENLVDVPGKLILTSIMWLSIYWFGALLKPRNLSFKSFRIIWIISITLAVISFLKANPYDLRLQFLEVFIPIYFFLYRGDYENQKSFMYAVNFRITRVLGFVPQAERFPGAVGWSLPTEFFALCLFIESVFFTFNGYPFALLSFLGAVILNSAVSTGLYTNDPNLKLGKKFNKLKRFLIALSVWLIGAFFIRISGIDSLNFLSIPLNLYILPSFLGVIYFPGDNPKDLEEQ